jgi:hypothetical protein
LRLGLLAMALLLVCGGALGGASSGAQAQQLDFKRVSRSGDELLSYRWRDPDKHEYSTAFTLTKQAIQQSETSFREFSLSAMWRYLELDLRDETQRFGQGAKINLSRTREGLHWTVQAPDQKIADQLMAKTKERLARSEKEYLAGHLRQRVDGRRIIVDFAAATTALQGPMSAVARALGATPNIENSDRARIALALAFFQEVPYAVLEDKERLGGDFLPAPALLAQNRGDCDSKAVALAAVLRTYVPGRKLVVVTMPEHAILAVEMPAGPGDWTIRDRGRQYVALEAAGPALAPVGQVGPHTAKYLKDGRETEIWPLN